MDHRYIGTEHLLVGLAEVGSGIGLEVLQELGSVGAIVAKVIEATTGAVESESRKLTLTEYYARREEASQRQETLDPRPTQLHARLERLTDIGLMSALSQPSAQSKGYEAIVQEERNRLARDLHDSVKQQLFSISISAAAVRERLESDPTGALAALADVQHSAQAAMVEIDALLHQLSPAPLATTGLIEALREQCEALGYRTGATVTTSFGVLPPSERLPTGTQEALFRMAQEALSNVARHARASEIHVQLELVADEKLLRLEVQDNGQGFDHSQSPKGMGLANLQARAATLQGHVEIHSTPGQGTLVRVDIPLVEEVNEQTSP
jgi:signal transduction histidine kinase